MTAKVEYGREALTPEVVAIIEWERAVASARAAKAYREGAAHVRMYSVVRARGLEARARAAEREVEEYADRALAAMRG